MRSVRVWFTKQAQAKYISHLDLMRFMTRAVRRAGIPIWYTEGFNPHPYMTFALPLSLGQESRCECMDIRVEGSMEDDEIERRLAAVMPEGIKITSVSSPVMPAGEIFWGEYVIEFFAENPDEMCEKFKALLDGGNIIAKKMGKSGRKKVEKEINLSESIYSYSISVHDGRLALVTVLRAGLKLNINPALLADALLKHADMQADEVNILRARLLTEDGNNFA